MKASESSRGSRGHHQLTAHNDPSIFSSVALHVNGALL